MCSIKKHNIRLSLVTVTNCNYMLQLKLSVINPQHVVGVPIS